MEVKQEIAMGIFCTEGVEKLSSRRLMNLLENIH